MPVFDATAINIQDLAVIAAMLSIAGVGILAIVHRALIYTKESTARDIAETLKEERGELEDRANQLEAFQKEINEITETLGKMAAEKLKLMRRKKKKASLSKLFVHEISGREPGRKLFEFPLQPIPGLMRVKQNKVIFHPDIWAYRNEAHVWPADYPVAQMLTGSVFNGASGVVIGSTAEPEPEEPIPDDAQEDWALEDEASVEAAIGAAAGVATGAAAGATFHPLYSPGTPSDEERMP